MLLNRCRNVLDSYRMDGFLKAAATGRSTLPAVVARGQAGLSAEELCENAMPISLRQVQIYDLRVPSLL